MHTKGCNPVHTRNSESLESQESGDWKTHVSYCPRDFSQRITARCLSKTSQQMLNKLTERQIDHYWGYRVLFGVIIHLPIMPSYYYPLNTSTTTQNELETHLNIDYANQTFDVETNLKKVAVKMQKRLPQYFSNNGTTAHLTDVPLALITKLSMGCLK